MYNLYMICYCTVVLISDCFNTTYMTYKIAVNTGNIEVTS